MWGKPCRSRCTRMTWLSPAAQAHPITCAAVKSPEDADRPGGDIAGALADERNCGWHVVPTAAETLGWTVVRI